MRHVPSSKIGVPDATHPVLPRPPLCAVLDAEPIPAVTTVIAPAGYGKSLLLADWVRTARHLPTAWVTLDEDDTDEQIWPAVVAALAVAAPEQEVGHVARAWANREWTGADDDGLVDDLLDASAVGGSARLVLDGVEHLGPAAARGLADLARGPGSGIRLVLAGRTDPDLPLARLRLEGRLRELREGDLRFAGEDVKRLLHLFGVTLQPAQAEELATRTGGWAAGLRLAACRLRGHDDPDRFLDEFPARDRAVADYLAVEVLDRLSAEERDLLRRASIVDSLPAALAPTLCDREDAAAVLDRIARRTGLLLRTETPGVGYRTQELLRSYLAADLERRGRDGVRALHRRAAAWFDGHGRAAEALRHAEAAGDAGLLRGLLGRRAAELAASGEHAVLADASLVCEGPVDPRVLLGTALADFGRGSARASAATLRALRRARPARDDPDLRSCRDAVERLCGASRPRRTVADPVPADPVLAAVSRAGTAAASLDRADVEGALDLASTYALTFLEVQCRCLLGLAHWLGGDLRAAAAHADDGVAAAVAHGWGSAPWVVAARAVVAYVATLRGQPERALTTASEGLLGAGLPVLRFALRSARGVALVDLGRPSAGVEELRRARVEATGTTVPPPVTAAAALAEHDTALRLGHQTIAAAALASLAGPAPAEFALARARSALAQGCPATARTLLGPVLTGSGAAPVLPVTLVEAWVLEANVAFASGDRVRTRAALHTAVNLAEPLDAVRPFLSLDEGPDATLVDLLGARDEQSGFAARALTLRTQAEPPPPCAGLSGREHDVLLRLQSPDSLDEIAEDLGVSVNTVKTHLRAIYLKLGVGGRRAAVVAAHHHGLFV